MLSLTEEIRVAGKIIEQDSKKLPPSVLCRVTYPVCRIGEKNKNHRVYDKKVWENVHSDAEIKEKLEKRCLFGAAEHPQETQPDLQKTSHVVTASWLDEKDNTVYQTFDILNTPYGKIVNTILEAGCQVGVSTRAEGELEEVTEGEEKYYKVIPDSYRYITTDFTADPSTEQPYPTKVERAVVTEIKSALDDKKIDEEYSALLLEKFECKEAVALLESMSEGARFKGDNRKKVVMKLGDKIKVLDGKYKDKKGIVAKVVEQQVNIQLEDGASISIEASKLVADDGKVEVIIPTTKEEVPEPEPVESEPEEVEEPAEEEVPKEEEREEEEEFESKKTTEAKMGVDYISTMKKAVKTATQALSDKDYEAAADDRRGFPKSGFAEESELKIDETADITAMYKAAGLPAPDGKGIHTKAFHKLAIDVAKGYVRSGDTPKQALDKAYPTAMSRLGKGKSVQKAHRSESIIKEEIDISKMGDDELVAKYEEYQAAFDSGQKDPWVTEKLADMLEEIEKRGLDIKESKLIFECFDDMVKYFEKEFPKIHKKQLEKQKDNKLIESSSITSVAKRMRELQISEASVRAERDKALEFIVEGDTKLESTLKSRQLEARILTQRLNKIQEEKQQEINILISTLEKRTKQIIETYKVNKHLEQRQLEESITHKKEVENITSKNNKQIKLLKEAQEKERIKLYVSTKIEHLGLCIHENTQALLERCTSFGQVDKLIEETQDAIKKSALHPIMFKEVGVQTEMDEQSRIIAERVVSVLDSFNK